MRSARVPFVLILLGSTALLAPAATSSPVPSEPVARCGAGPTSGTLGVGDAYFPRYGNGGYDVEHYDLAIRYAPARNHVRGTATLSAIATQDLTCFSLDLVGLTVGAITIDGAPAIWSRTDHELMVAPAQPLEVDAAFEVIVRYRGKPRTFRIPGFGAPAGFIRTNDGAIVAGEPESAAGWFPVNDHPVDRASYTFRIAVPPRFDVVANGIRESRTSTGGWTTHVWQAHDPMASYLATFDVGEWDMRFRQTASGLPVIDAVDPDVTRVNRSLRREPEIVSFLESQFGPYPFESVGAIIPDTGRLAFALETQTRPIYSRYFFPFGGDNVIVHELAHQWFGDLVAVDRWQHIWLNEGFATYAEWLWSQHEGFGTPQQIFEALWSEIGPRSGFWWVVVGDPGVDALFDGAVYLRGAMTLQALRNEVGDDAFWTILHSWTEMNAFGTGTTEEFIALSELVSGEQLDDLFDLWLFTPSRPPASAVTASGVVSVTPMVTERAAAWFRDLERRLSRSG